MGCRWALPRAAEGSARPTAPIFPVPAAILTANRPSTRHRSRLSHAGGRRQGLLRAPQGQRDAPSPSIPLGAAGRVVSPCVGRVGRHPSHFRISRRSRAARATFVARGSPPGALHGTPLSS